VLSSSSNFTRRLSKASKGDIFSLLEKNMGTKVKLVQPTEIKDKKTIKEIIEQIRKPIPRSVEKKLEKEDELIMKFFK
jgi:hypothetical protein